MLNICRANVDQLAKNLQPTDTVSFRLPISAIRHLRVLARSWPGGASEGDVAGQIIKEHLGKLIARKLIAAEPPNWTVYADDPKEPETPPAAEA